MNYLVHLAELLVLLGRREFLQKTCSIGCFHTLTMYDLQTKDICTKESYAKRRYFQGVSTDLVDKASHLTAFCANIYEIAVPISQSPQCS